MYTRMEIVWKHQNQYAVLWGIVTLLVCVISSVSAWGIGIPQILVWLPPLLYVVVYVGFLFSWRNKTQRLLRAWFNLAHTRESSRIENGVKKLAKLNGCYGAINQPQLRNFLKILLRALDAGLTEENVNNILKSCKFDLRFTGIEEEENTETKETHGYAILQDNRYITRVAKIKVY